MAQDLYRDRLRVVLVSTRNPLNIGAAARAMSNFGFFQLRVVTPYDLAFREARSAVGASGILKHAAEHATIQDAVADSSLIVGTTAARDRDLHHPLRSLQQGAVLIRKALGSSRVALLFGSEKRGLSNEDFTHCHWLMRIPTLPEQPSMNLGQAVAVCLYEISHDSKIVYAAEGQEAAPARDLERLNTSLREALRASGYTLTGKTDEQKLRRLIHRLNLSSVDCQLLLGMLRQMLWKMQDK